MAGTGEPGDGGDGGPALQATITLPVSMAIDTDGSVVFADQAASAVRRIATDGTITTVAGTGVAGDLGDCGPAAAAQLDGPYGITIHDGVLYIVDEGNARIRMVVP